jgi:hypothetical protein
MTTEKVISISIGIPKVYRDLSAIQHKRRVVVGL